MVSMVSINGKYGEWAMPPWAVNGGCKYKCCPFSS